MTLGRIETVKIKIGVGDSIFLIEKMKENLPVLNLSMDCVLDVRDNGGVRTTAKVNDIRIADIYPYADVKDWVRAGFIHDEYVPALMIQGQL